MTFAKVEKYSGLGELVGASVRASKNKKELRIILGQDVVKRFDLHGVGYMEVHVGEDRDTGKLLLVKGERRNGYRVQFDEHGKATIQFVKPGLVKQFCNGHSRIECTVIPHEMGICLCGNNRG